MTPERLQESAPRVLIVTNVPAPYRLPVWSELSKALDLTVGFLDDLRGGSEGIPKERADDWRHEASRDSSYKLRKIVSWQFSFRENHYYLAKPRRAFHISTFDLVLICGWDSPAYWQALFGARANHLPVLAFYESTIASSRFEKGIAAAVRRRFFAGLDATIVPGRSAEESVRSKGAERVFRGFNAVDMRPFRAAAQRRDSLCVQQPSGKAFLFVGKLVRRKNVDSILRGFATLPDDTYLAIAGSGPEEQVLRALCEELRISERVQFLGYVPYQKLPETMVRYDHLVLTSHTEVWGLTVNEALASGLHVIVSKTSGVASDIGHMHGVFLSNTLPDGIAAAMRRSVQSWVGHIKEPEILAHTPERLAETQLEAIRWALDRYRNGRQSNR